jgi:hypothetical protein
LRRVTVNHCCRGKAVSVTYSECMSVAVVTLHAQRMRRITLYSVIYLGLVHFSTLSHKRHDFRAKCIENTLSLFSVQLLSGTFLILSNIERDIISVHNAFMQYARYFCQILRTLEFCRHIFKHTQISNFMKIRPMGAGRTDGQDEADSAFRHFVIVSKKFCVPPHGVFLCFGRNS